VTRIESRRPIIVLTASRLLPAVLCGIGGPVSSSTIAVHTRIFRISPLKNMSKTPFSPTSDR
jgi:hypothetical protein